MTTRRERLRTQTVADIKAMALDHVRHHGAQDVSLRAVARDLGMSAPGLYRYYDSREALLTDLIADSFHALADAIEAARDADPAASLGDRLFAAALAYRGWAVEHPNEFGLIYGTPIPDYAAPLDGPTSPASGRVGTAFLTVFVAAFERGDLRLDDIAVDPGLEGPLGAYGAELRPGFPAAAVRVALGAWGQMHGMVCLEVFNHLSWLLTDASRFYRDELTAMCDRLGLPVSPD